MTEESGDLSRLRLERDLLLRVLELGARDELAPFLEDALALVVGVTGARKGYLELRGQTAGDDARHCLAHGFSDAEIGEVRKELSGGIIAQALQSGVTLSTASALDDPRFRDQASVQAQRIRAVLCAPIGREPAFGVLYLQERAAPGPFPESDRQTAELLARHLAPLADRLLAREEVRAGVDHTHELRTRLSVDSLVGTSRALAAVFRQLAVAAPVPVPVLIFGESGTGKTAAARAIHESSTRARGPFVEVNCAAIPEALFESELFGAEKGAHSTATRLIEGKIDAARGGTLFLDEVGELPLLVQGKLLMFLQSRRYYRLGSNVALDADVRVIAATNAALEDRVAEKRFREDLFYRLNVLEVRLPPLRERTEDIGPIADAVARALGEAHGHPLPLTRAARVALAESEWPGNVRQLENALQRGWATALSEGASAIEPQHLFPERAALLTSGGEAPTYQEAVRAFQGRFLREALERAHWNVSETARQTGLARSHLNDLIRAHGLVRAARK